MSTDTVTVTINGFTAAAEPTCLWRHYSGQFAAQEVYVELDTRDGELAIDYNGEVGNAVPEAVWHGQVLRFNLPIIPTAEGANWLLGEVAPMAQAILDALAAEADNPAADPWSDPAESPFQAAKDALAGYLAGTDDLPDSYIVAQCSSDEVDMLAEGYAVAADATDAEIEALAAEILTDYASNSGFGAAVCSGLVYHLEQTRDKAASEAYERISDIVSDL